jgi:hypothetical protein
MGDAAGRKRINPDLQDGVPIRVQGCQLAENGFRILNGRQQRQRRSKGPEPCGFVAFVPFCSSNGSDSDLDAFLAKNAERGMARQRLSLDCAGLKRRVPCRGSSGFSTADVADGRRGLFGSAFAFLLRPLRLLR